MSATAGSGAAALEEDERGEMCIVHAVAVEYL